MSRALGLIVLVAALLAPTLHAPSAWEAPLRAAFTGLLNRTGATPVPAVPAPEPEPAPAPEPVDPLPQTIARLEAYVVTPGFNGALLVAKGDQVLLRRAFGEADHEQRTPLTPETRFRVASVSKQFTAAAILRLQDQGILSVNDRVCRWINPCPTAWSDITLHHLLTHTSGIRDITRRPGWLENRRVPRTPEQLHADSARLPLDFPPGTQMQYSNAGYNLLGDVVAIASGQPFHDFLKAQFFDPLGMPDTGFDDGNAGTAMGYAWLPERTPQPVSNASLVYASGGLYSTLDDMLIWHRAMHKGGLLSEASYRQMITPHAAPERRPNARFEPSRFGYGLMLADLGERMAPIYVANQIYHTGSWGGFRALAVYDPAHDVTAIAWTNHYPRMDALFMVTQWAVAELAGAPLPDGFAGE